MNSKMTEAEILKKFPGLSVGRQVAKGKLRTRGAQLMRRELCGFAQEHKLIINPNGYEYYIESFLMFNCCPCDKRRLHCPCPESIADIEKRGHCLCKLFWRDYNTYREQMLDKE